MRRVLRLKSSLCCNRNLVFVVGVLLGVFLSVSIPEQAFKIAHQECHEQSTQKHYETFSDDFEPRLNLVNKPMAAKKQVKNIIRPRYYSSELGIREKLFVGVLSSVENINTIATAFNRTVAHLADKIKFFINADNVRSNFKLKNIVGFTDTRENLRPFHVLKYIADNYLDDFDYFLLLPDTSYVDVRRLRDELNHISIAFDIYMGTQVNDVDANADEEKVFCDFQAGIVLSSSVIRKIRTSIDWCVRNTVSSFHSLNLGKCVAYSTKLGQCQTTFQDRRIDSYHLNTHKIYRDLNILKDDHKFNNAVILYPVQNFDDFYILHAYFSRLHLESIKLKGYLLQKNAHAISNGTLPNSILEIRWPLGVPERSVPETRHDIIVWTSLNETHIIMPDNEHTSKKLSKIDAEDLNRILSRTTTFAKSKYPYMEYQSIHTAYRRFDPVRGMDYQLMLRFIDKSSNEEIIKSFEVVKPLGRVEIVPSPYVTESTRIALLLPVFEHQVDEALQFVVHYEKICMENQDNTFLMLIFMYNEKSPSKGDEDAFKTLKTSAIDVSEKYRTDGSRIAWVSIRLPTEFVSEPTSGDRLLTSVFASNEILSLAVIDLALRKIGLESLVVLCSNSVTFRPDFLNRVRMNTIQGFQIFSPIGFMMYPCDLANFCRDCDTCDVSQSSGYFDKTNFDVASFYSRDYVEARKAMEDDVPIVRADRDIVNLLSRKAQNVTTVMDMFLHSEHKVHILRAIEPNLRYGGSLHDIIDKSKPMPVCPDDTNSKCVHLASRKQIGDALVKYEDSIMNRKKK